MRDLNPAFAKIFKKQRESLELTQEELAFECGVSRNFISLIETGETLPSLPILFTIAKGLNTTPDELIKKVRLSIEKSSK